MAWIQIGFTAAFLINQWTSVKGLINQYQDVRTIESQFVCPKKWNKDASRVTISRSHISDWFMKMNSTNYRDITIPGWSLYWKNLKEQNVDDIFSELSAIFPTIGHYRNFFYSMGELDTFDEAFMDQERKMKWPDNTYERWLSQHESSTLDKNDVLMGTYRIQNWLWKRQHPMNCDNVRYGIIGIWRGGIGSALHWLTRHMAAGLTLDDTSVFMYDPMSRHTWTHGPYCNRVYNYECFFEPLTNCTFQKRRDNIRLERIYVCFRHGDKAAEMTLIDEREYMPVIEMYMKMYKKQYEDMKVFVSTEDPKVINYFRGTRIPISYFNYSRANEHFRGLYRLGSENVLISLANLKISLQGNMAIETLESNWNRLIMELRSTSGWRASTPMVEVGHFTYLSAEHAWRRNGSLIWIP